MNNRWWEFYLVRYFVGTVFGTLISLFLYSKKFSGFYDLNVSLKDFSNAHIIFFGLIGLAYCYLASAPILVLHATRSSLFSKKSYFFPALLSGLAIIAALIFYFTLREKLNWIVLALIFSLQITIITLSLRKETSNTTTSSNESNLFVFYRSLIGTRANAVLNTSNGSPTTIEAAKITEYKESYKHLREHGNAFTIVLMEFILAVILYYMDNIQQVVISMIVWAIPSSFVWFIGTYLENKISKI
ncbi:hypothetical protein [Paenibacillus sp. FSL R10-2734]|uniref:hypothetical protein n=1 Tax=Paenibacillus sp. FSL R10-2734 TaxID=2954691 RepID=UPI0030D90828